MNEDDGAASGETVAELRKSFYYGSRSNLNFKFVNDLSDEEFGQFLEELFEATAHAIDTGEADQVVDAAYRWQVHGYSGHLGDPSEFRYRYEDVPITPMAKPLSESKLFLLTSSGHFVEGEDPEPLGVKNMTQAEAESRVSEFMREAPKLSAIPVDTPLEELRVLHGGYPVQAAKADPQVVLPLEHLKALVDAGVIGELVDTVYSFIGVTSQGRLRKESVPSWVDLAREHEADAALLVPI